MKNLFCIALVFLLLTIFSRVSAQEAPVIVNPETGAVVNLTRAYWDANVDIADKRMQCDYFSFDAETGVFVKAPAYYGDPGSDISTLSTQFSHAPLPNDTRQVNIAGVLSDGLRGDFVTDRYSSWSVVGGRYQGPAPLVTSDFVEIVAFNASIENAVRVWVQGEPVSAYSVCYDLDGTPLLPTGTVGSDNSQLVDLPGFTFDFPDEYESIPEIVNRETGETVEITRGRWSYNKDIASNSLTCLNVPWGRGSYEQQSITAYEFVFFPYNGGDLVPTSVRATDTDSYPSQSDQSTTSFTLPGDSFETYMEITEYGYRMWSEDGGGYEECFVQVGRVGLTQDIKVFGPTEFLPLTTDETLSAVTNDTTPLEVTDNCDYTDADDYDGYGYDPVAMMSCPPLANNGSVDETTGATTDVEDTGATQNSNVAQTETSTDNSTVSSNDTAENEVLASNTQSDSTSTVLASSDDGASESGGGSFWLPALMFALAFRRQMVAVQPT